MKKILYGLALFSLIGIMVGCSSEVDLENTSEFSTSQQLAVTLMASSNAYLNEVSDEDVTVEETDTEIEENKDDFSQYFDIAEMIITDALHDLDSVNTETSSNELYSYVFNVVFQDVNYQIDYNIDEEGNIDGIASIIVADEMLSYPVVGMIKTNDEKEKNIIRLDISFSDKHSIRITSGSANNNERLTIREENDGVLTATVVSTHSNENGTYVKVVTRENDEKDVYAFYNSNDASVTKMWVEYELEDGTKGILKQTTSTNDLGEETTEYNVIEKRGFFAKRVNAKLQHRHQNVRDRIKAYNHEQEKLQCVENTQEESSVE